MADGEESRADWPEAMAEVTGCHYDVRAGRALAFGLSSDKHFRIDYNYRVGDELHTGQCFSQVARPQGSLFAVHYDPSLPHISHHPGSVRRRGIPLLVIAGCILLGAAAFLLLRGCL